MIFAEVGLPVFLNIMFNCLEILFDDSYSGMNIDQMWQAFEKPLKAAMNAMLKDLLAREKVCFLRFFGIPNRMQFQLVELLKM